MKSLKRFSLLTNSTESLCQRTFVQNFVKTGSSILFLPQSNKTFVVVNSESYCSLWSIYAIISALPVSCFSRPDASFMWFLNPLKSIRYIVWHNYKWRILKMLIVMALVFMFFLFFYSIPGYTVKRMMGAWVSIMYIIYMKREQLISYLVSIGGICSTITKQSNSS